MELTRNTIRKMSDSELQETEAHVIEYIKLVCEYSRINHGADWKPVDAEKIDRLRSQITALRSKLGMKVINFK